MVPPAVPSVDDVHYCAYLFNPVFAGELAALQEQAAPRHGRDLVLLVRVEQGRESLYFQPVRCRFCDWCVYGRAVGQHLLPQDGWHGVHVHGDWGTVSGPGTINLCIYTSVFLLLRQMI